MSNMQFHPSVAAVLEHFEYGHLPEHLARVSAPHRVLAYEMAQGAPDDPETTVGLRKLLEAKDCFVRAAVREARKRGTSGVGALARPAEDR